MNIQILQTEFLFRVRDKWSFSRFEYLRNKLFKYTIFQISTIGKIQWSIYPTLVERLAIVKKFIKTRAKCDVSRGIVRRVFVSRE